jgi:hypothetical protein
MAKQQIEINISGGKAEVKTEGFEGRACMDATADLEAAMGLTVDDQKTPEYDVKHVQQAGT